jgi:hypothetical protein
MKTMPRKFWDGRCYNPKIKDKLLERYAMPTVAQVLDGKA